MILEKKKYKVNYLFNKIFKENFKKKLTIDWSKTPKRYAIINDIISRNSYKKYLEIGCFKDEAFSRINIEHKVGVDPVSGGTIRLNSDDFFKSNKENFDIIFIDGLHEYSQVKKDIANSLSLLNINGVLLMHDCMPLKIRDQMMPRSHEHWNGDVWKALVEARTSPNIDTCTILADQGIGMILKRKNRNLLDINCKNFKALKFKDYYNNYEKFMNPVDENKFLSLFN
jgi:hypothetical protein